MVVWVPLLFVSPNLSGSTSGTSLFQEIQVSAMTNFIVRAVTAEGLFLRLDCVHGM